MNKPIIVDGVDVSECPDFNWNGYCKTGYKPEEEPYCENFTCNYKQLQRLKAENGKYKQALIEIEKICEMVCGDCQYNPNWYNQDCECEFTDECEEIKIKDIIQKINEVLK